MWMRPMPHRALLRVYGDIGGYRALLRRCGVFSRMYRALWTMYWARLQVSTQQKSVDEAKVVRGFYRYIVFRSIDAFARLHAYLSARERVWMIPRPDIKQSSLQGSFADNRALLWMDRVGTRANL